MLQRDRWRPNSVAEHVGSWISWLSAKITGWTDMDLQVPVRHLAREQWLAVHENYELTRRPWLPLPVEFWHFLLPWCQFCQDIHSMGIQYTNLCLWFDEVKVKTNVKLVFMFVNILFPSKRYGFFMQLTTYWANVFKFRDSLKYLNIHKLLFINWSMYNSAGWSTEFSSISQVELTEWK